MTNPREQRGIQLAETKNIKRNGKCWVVPSQSGDGKYVVDLDAETPHCTCPDHEIRRMKCKHIFAVEYSIRQETDANGTTVTETLKVTRKTYRQNWPAYNAAQTNEKAQFQALLHDLCAGIEEPEQTKGRPRLPLRDMVFTSAFKVFSAVSGRRFMSDLSDAHGKGYVTKVPHYNSIFNYLEMPGLSPLLRELITQSSLPLKSVEADFAVDSSGFSTCGVVRWFNARYGHAQDNRDWVKAHLMCGVKTNIVTSIEITERHANDGVQLPALVEATAKNFTMTDVCADKAYGFKDNLKLIESKGATPFIAFKSSHTAGRDGGIWERMFHFYSYRREEFLDHYHKRSNIESTFNMIKAKFGESLRSKTPVAQHNELLCKVLCHNLCCVIQSMYELEITPTFWAESSLAQKIA